MEGRPERARMKKRKKDKEKIEDGNRGVKEVEEGRCNGRPELHCPTQGRIDNAFYWGRGGGVRNGGRGTAREADIRPHKQTR